MSDFEVLHLNNISNQEKKRVFKEAQKTLNHHFEVLSKTIKFPKEIDWHTNFSGKSWPMEPFLEFRANNYDFNSKSYISDIKLPWEFNKHLYFQDLAKAYLLTKDEKYTREFIYELEDWLKNNPYKMGVNWTEGLIVSHRMISWVISLSVFESSPEVSKEFLKKIHDSLYQHALFIEETYEFCPRASNHLLGEFCAQIILSVLFPNFDNSKKRLKDAIEKLQEELELQVYADGVDYEQSISYQRVILEFLYLPLILAKRKLVKLPQSIWDKAEKMTEFLMHMTQPNGFMQPISDADGARVFLLGNDINDFRPHLALASWLFDRGDFKFVSSGCDEEIKWFLNSKEYEALENIECVKPKKMSVAFGEGGYWVLRNGWSKDSTWLFFDCGYMGMGKWPKNLLIGVHGHSDILNFGLCVEGETILTDNGSYAYTTERPFHQYFRSSCSHNIALIDGQDQNVIENKPWLAFQHALPQNAKHYFSDKVDYISGEHTGYQRLPNQVMPRREIMFFKAENFIILKDTFFTQGHHSVTELFHLMPKLKVSQNSNGYKIKGQRSWLEIQAFFPFQNQRISGKSNPPEGWYAPTFGTKIKSHVLKFKTEIKGNTELFFLFNWGNKNLSKSSVVQIFNETYESLRQPRVVMLVTNDLRNDPRVQKEAQSIALTGFDTLVVGVSLVEDYKKVLLKNCKVSIVNYRPFSIIKPLRHYVGHKIMAIYYKMPRFGNFIMSILGHVKNNIRSKVIDLIDNDINQPLEKKSSMVSGNEIIQKKQKMPNFLVLVLKAIFYYYSLNKLMIREALTFEPDIVHAHDLDTLLAGYLIKKQTGAKLVYDSHEIWTKQGMPIPKIFIWCMSLLEKKLIKKVDALISVNESIINELEKMYSPVKIPKIVIYNCPKITKTYPKKSSKTIKVIYQGRFAPNRGLENLVLAVRYFQPNIKLYFRCTGEEDVKNNITKLIEKYHLCDKIILLEPVEMDQMVEGCQFADIGVIPYLPTNRNNQLATPNKLYEYSMAGLAIACSDLIELKKFVKSYQNGLLFNPQEPKSIAKIINQLARDKKTLKEMKKNSLIAAKEYNWENQSQKLNQLYRSLLEKESNE